MALDIRPIGYVRGGRQVAEDDDWGQSRCRIELDTARFTADALVGLEKFSHAEIIFLFDRVSANEIVTTLRHPRGRTDWPMVGIFAQRGKNRPNRLGVTVCSIIAVTGTTLELKGLDAIDGTPVMDIKPVMREFLPRGEVRQPEWASELMKSY